MSRVSEQAGPGFQMGRLARLMHWSVSDEEGAGIIRLPQWYWHYTASRQSSYVTPSLFAAAPGCNAWSLRICAEDRACLMRHEMAGSERFRALGGTVGKTH